MLRNVVSSAKASLLFLALALSVSFAYAHEAEEHCMGAGMWGGILSPALLVWLPAVLLLSLIVIASVFFYLGRSSSR